MNPAAWWPLRRARDVVLDGGVIAYPTEAVFGLGCDPLEYGAVQRILALKRRDAAKGLILVAARLEQLLPYVAPLTPDLRKKLDATWPGPVTWVLPAAAYAPFWLTGGRASLAVRVTAHPVARRLCELCDMALVSTSANKSGHPPARTGLQVRSRLGAEVDCIAPGRVGSQSRPTEIRDALSGTVLRAG
jgi:L-threonylcarbamoyladenylate synthase